MIFYIGHGFDIAGDTHIVQPDRNRNVWCLKDRSPDYIYKKFEEVLRNAEYESSQA